jgi:hypothetical protein
MHNLIFRWLFTRSKNMSQQDQERPQEIIAEISATTADAGNLKVSSKKRKEDAKQTLYLKRM